LFFSALWVAVIGISSVLSAQAPLPEGPAPGAASVQPRAPVPVQAASISGTVVDQDGAVVSNVKITLTQPGVTAKSETVSDDAGRFAFAGVVPGAFQLTLNASGFANVEKSGVAPAGEDYVIPPIALAVARANVDVEVTLPSEQVAEDQVKVEEQQRLLGIVPNYYVSYVPHAAPLTPRLKFELAWKTTFDPVSLVITGGIAGIEQATNAYDGFGQGAQGYGKRFGTAYADFVSGTFIGGAILPSILKQDPRYFYKGTGSRTSRFLYAVANAVICKGDNGRWQANYSSILGGLAAGAISNLYYPPQNRNGAALTFENAAIGTGFGAVGNIIQEFFLRKLTPHVPAQEPAKP